MADLIDRDAAYDAIGFERCDRSCADCPTKCTWFYTVNNIPAVNRWIPCSERFPEDNCYTLVAVLFDEIYEVYIAAFRGDGWHTVEGYVTHWMPLPDPPEGGAGNAVHRE